MLVSVNTRRSGKANEGHVSTSSTGGPGENALDIGGNAYCSPVVAVRKYRPPAIRAENAALRGDPVPYGSNGNVDPRLLETMEWRQVGPFRGGRVVAVAGHPTEPTVFYFGATSGGVWMSDDAGAYWENISDGFFNTAAVGAIAVSASDPNVLYAGTGEACIRGNVSHGDGVYRTTDAGKTWQNVGLQDTRHIGRVRIHPSDPDTVYVAALGHAFGPNRERGVFRSRDGGGTWEHVLNRSDKAGAVDLSMDPNNPRILYAAVWEAVRTPSSMTSGGTDSGIFKSMDGGDTWSELTHNPGLPEGPIGRVGVAVSPAQRDRVWALIEAEYEDAGLYRSDDGGTSWERVSDDRALVQRPWYYSHVFADPQDPETAWVLNLKTWKSNDGGRNFDEIAMPHGDHHDLWIDPENTQRIIQGNDGGATVTLNGGGTWSSIYNQPTAQYYHIDVDNQFPYRIYATQQDNSAVSSPSRSITGAFDWGDCYPCGNSESGHIAVRPDNPNIVYSGAIGSSPGGGDSLLRYDHTTGQVRIISVWPEMSYGQGVGELKYRFQWTYPIVISPHDPNVLYVAANVVFRSENEGTSWEVISPDLTRDDRTKMERSGGPLTGDMTGVEHYGTIFAFAESPHEPGVLWAASDDGLVHLSRDAGNTWLDVTPSDLPEWTLIGTIEPSPHDASTVYISATRYKFDDPKPYLYKTSDSGESWTKITDGIPETEYTRVIREDPSRRGLLYSGTERGVYVSFDDGAAWQSLNTSPSESSGQAPAASSGQSLPVVPVHDLKIKGTELVAGTHGRSIWILDDLELLRQLGTDTPDDSLRLFEPGATYRVAPHMDIARPTAPGKNYHMTLGARATFYDKKQPDGEDIRVFLDSGKNPPDGVIVSYWLGEDSAKDGVKVSFTDAGGSPINSYGSEEKTTPSSEDAEDKEPRAPAKPGMNRFVWNMRHPDGPKVPGDKLAEKGSKGPAVKPGKYQVHLTVGEVTHTKSFELLTDPRVSATEKDYQEQFDLLLRIHGKMSELNNGINKLRYVRDQVDEWSARAAGNEDWKGIPETAAKIKGKLEPIENTLVSVRSVKGSDLINLGARLNVKLAELTSVVASADAGPTKQSFDVLADLSGRIDTQLASLQEVVDTDLQALIALVHELEVPPVVPKPRL